MTPILTVGTFFAFTVHAPNPSITYEITDEKGDDFLVQRYQDHRATYIDFYTRATSLQARFEKGEFYVISSSFEILT